MSKFNPTKKRSGIAEQNQYGSYSFYGGRKIICVGKTAVHKGQQLPVRDFDLERMEWE